MGNVLWHSCPEWRGRAGGAASGAGSFKRRASTRLRPRYVNTTQRGNNDGIAFWRVRIVAWLARMTYRYR
jgi:hypothetical protein